jgi:hypothetical protein
VADLFLERHHRLGLARARQLAGEWIAQAEHRLDMACELESGDEEDLVRFSRKGVVGTLRIGADSFVMEARLSSVLGVLRKRIEREIAGRLDTLLGAQSRPHQGFSDSTSSM